MIPDVCGTIGNVMKDLVKSLADYGYYALCFSEANDWVIGTDHGQMIHYTNDVDTTEDVITTSGDKDIMMPEI